MANEVSTQAFDYTELDAITADFLRRKESNMREIVGKAYTDLGRELKEARDKLAGSNQYDGLFRKWCDSIGMKKDAVSRLIQRYELVAICDDQSRELIEDLPLSLTYEIAKPSAESTDAKAQAKSEVLDGSIATLKEYRERIAELELQAKQATEKAEQAESARQIAEQREFDAKRSAEIANRQNERLSEELATATKPETVVVEKEVERVVEIDKTDYSAVERLRAYEERFGALENYSDRVRATNVSDATTAIVSFNMAVRDFIKRHAFLIKYNDTIQYVDQVTQREYNEAVQALREISADFSKVTGIGNFVDVEFSEVQQ